MKRIGIVSDTHGLLRDNVTGYLKDCDCIFHGGDINCQEILDRLKKIAPLYAVRGNNDKEWAEYLPKDLKVQVEEVSIYMVHNKKEASAELSGVNVVIYGHSHKYQEAEIDGRLWLNPGSCGKRRFDQEITMAVMMVDGSQYTVEKISLENDARRKQK